MPHAVFYERNFIFLYLSGNYIGNGNASTQYVRTTVGHAKTLITMSISYDDEGIYLIYRVHKKTEQI